MAWLNGWLYRKEITVSNSSASYQTKLSVYEGSGTDNTNIVYCGGKVLSSFNDLRFTGSDGITLLDYWIESITGTTPNQLATVWVENDATPSTTCYMYYGKADATAVSNGANTFIFFDHFDVDLSKWTTGGTPTIASSILTLNAVGELIRTPGTYGINTALRGRFYFTAAVGVGEINLMQYGDWVTTNSLCRIGEQSSPLFLFSQSGDDAGTTEISNAIATMDRSYNVWEICRNGSTSNIYRKNDSTIDTDTTRVGTLARYIGFYCGADTENILADWILVRKLAAIEQSFAFGSEERVFQPWLILL